MILTAGPSITEKEISYVMDAVKNGWNFHHSDYNKKFAETLARYTGSKYCVPMASGTGAMHIGVLACGVKKGDEVIVPDMGYISASNAVEYMGAKPVFADVDEENWCLYPESVEKNITKKTKAIMPVWMYGSVPRMGELMEIAEKHGLKVVEDACPGLGALYRGRMAGSIGDAGTFSFQGAKTFVMGEGGALITSDDKVCELALSYHHNCRDPKRQFWHTDIGFMYTISNLQCAIGLAQVERAEELTEKKRRVFGWYRKRLEGVEFLSLNHEDKDTRNGYWMTSIVLNGKSPVKRDELRAKLLERKIDTRPFFYPISMFPMYRPLEKKNPVSYRVGLNGINLPSGVMLTEEQVDYVCSAVLEILGVKR